MFVFLVGIQTIFVNSFCIAKCSWRINWTYSLDNFSISAILLAKIFDQSKFITLSTCSSICYQFINMFNILRNWHCWRAARPRYIFDLKISTLEVGPPFTSIYKWEQSKKWEKMLFKIYSNLNLCQNVIVNMWQLSMCDDYQHVKFILMWRLLKCEDYLHMNKNSHFG